MAQNGLVPLMPHATAAWLVDNTALSFQQIAEFCGLHILEVQAMADDMTGTKYTGRDPVRAGELTMEEIEKGQADADYALKISKGPEQVRRTKGPRYTPVSKRQDKPDGIAWILRNHPEVSDAQIGKLIGTTRNTIGALREPFAGRLAHPCSRVEIADQGQQLLGFVARGEVAHVKAEALAPFFTPPTDEKREARELGRCRARQRHRRRRCAQIDDVGIRHSRRRAAHSRCRRLRHVGSLDYWP
jgi:hypothetical protein